MNFFKTFTQNSLDFVKYFSKQTNNTYKKNLLLERFLTQEGFINYSDIYYSRIRFITFSRKKDINLPFDYLYKLNNCKVYVISKYDKIKNPKLVEIDDIPDLEYYAISYKDFDSKGNYENEYLFLFEKSVVDAIIETL
jgi:hypothetical protein